MAQEPPWKTIRKELVRRGIRHRVEENGALIRIPLDGVNWTNITSGAQGESKVTNGRWTYPTHLQSIQKIIPGRADHFFHVSEADYSHIQMTIEEAAAEAVRMKNAAEKRPFLAANKKIMKTPIERLVREVMDLNERTKLFKPASLVIRIASLAKLAEKLKHR